MKHFYLARGFTDPFEVYIGMGHLAHAGKGIQRNGLKMRVRILCRPNIDFLLKDQMDRTKIEVHSHTVFNYGCTRCMKRLGL